jgi:hypothetical protein
MPISHKLGILISAILSKRREELGVDQHALSSSSSSDENTDLYDLHLQD